MFLPPSSWMPKQGKFHRNFHYQPLLTDPLTLCGDIIIFSNGNLDHLQHLNLLLGTFTNAIGMLINIPKSSLECCWGMISKEKHLVEIVFSTKMVGLNQGLKYIDFMLKKNNHTRSHQHSLPKNIEKSIRVSCNKRMYRNNKLILCKLVIEAVCGAPLAWIPFGILHEMQQLYS